MANVEHAVDIEASPETVYQISQDYSVRYSWDPFPEKIELLHGATVIAKGVRAFVVAKTGLRMEVVFIQVSPPTTAAIKMIKGPFFLKAFAGSWVFRLNGSGGTAAKFIYAIKSKWWALPWVTDYVASWYFSNAVKKRLNGLKAYCESLA